MEADINNFTGGTCKCFKNTNSTKSTKVVWRNHFKKYYWKPYFWSDSYFISSVSENSLHTIKQYIRNQRR
ncbi:MAG: transposase [Anaerostipes hadrus]